jgi:DNA-binding transcriptional ArsR family regulator
MTTVLFNLDDIAHTRVAAEPSEPVELAYSLRMLDEPPNRCFAGWRQHLRGRVDPRIRRYRISSTLDGVSGLADGECAEAVARYRQLAIAPFWERIRLLIEADRRRRARILLDGGIAALLATLHPALRWQPGPVGDVEGRTVLQVSAADGLVPVQIDLAGRGLLLQPSVFVWRAPTLWTDPTGQPVLVYGVSCELSEPDRETGDLADLIGRTRAALLDTLGGGAATTTELARAAGLSLAAASQHTSVLRGSGLICTQRMGRARLHTLTALGAAVLATSGAIRP